MKTRLLILAILLLSFKMILANDNNKVPFSNWNTGILSLQEDLPEDFPKIKVDIVNNPFPGKIVMECFQVSTPEPNYIMISDENGNIEYFHKAQDQGADFKIQPNGRFSYASRVKVGDKYQAGPITVQNIKVQHKILDSDFNTIDSVQMQNELLADMHEFVILPNGNYLALSYEAFPIDMSKLIPNGNPNAFVIGTILQELDKDKNCVFQWRSLDYIPVLASKDNLTKTTFEHVHGNSMFLDKDGNMIVSFPTSFEIVKIDMVTGKMVWRFGGDSNEFKITGDNELDKPYYFRMQHDVKRLENGNMLFYDNAAQKKSGWNSRAVEYEFNEDARTAHLVWEFKHNPPISAFAMGSAQRLKNGNTLIDWGLMFMGTQKAITEVTMDKETTFEMTFPSLTFSYRAHKYDLPACQPVAEIDKFEILSGNKYNFKDEDNDTGIEITFNDIQGFIYNNVNVKRYDCASLDPEFEGEAPVILQGRYEILQNMIDSFDAQIVFRANTFAPHKDPSKLIVYYRKEIGHGLFIPLETTYLQNTSSENKHSLSVNAKDFGEYIIGYPREESNINPPILQYPLNNYEIINASPIKFVWSSTGRYDNFDIQISSDSDFQNIVFESYNVKIPILTLNEFEPSTRYYWRTRTNYRDFISDWSETYQFNLSDSFLEMVYPIGGETLSSDSSYIIKWNTNISDSVKIELLLNGELKRVISEGIFSYFDSFLWDKLNALESDTRYSIRITNTKNNEQIAESEFFSIDNTVNVAETLFDNIDIEISPNPVNEFLKISLNTEINLDSKISIINMYGISQKIINGKMLNDGTTNGLLIDTSDLLPGVYYCLVQTGKISKLEKFVVIR